MDDVNPTEKILEICSRVLKNQPRSKRNEVNIKPLSECVLICKRRHDNLFQIQKGILRIENVDELNVNKQFIVSKGARIMIIVE